MQIIRFTLFSILIIVVIAALVVFTQDSIYPPIATAENQVQRSHKILAVDLNGNNQINQAELAAGKDAILTIKANLKVKQTGNIFFSSYEALERLDHNKDGRLDAEDSAYSHLQLLFLRKGKQQKLLPLAEAGIQAIILNQQKETQDKVVGHALMADGTTRAIYLVDIRIPREN